ncbi:hypothetical protein [Pseudonocardia sp.]|jgi:hypothetical protein|uniref:helix-turn-helix domain-containing protein n=1 Tax=Pseudonocardia sp. TaxID=60912 RepID=UPI0028C9D164|nr:hypothetical protein [Pseudonocardia sp.]MDT7616856.1 hypothetical protein [Pseudonocardiales bacterium]
MTYFAPEPGQHLVAAGLEPGRMSYLAVRSAPMGAVGLVGAGLDALVSYTATGRGFVVPFATGSRGWSQEQWNAAVVRLAEASSMPVVP